MTVGGEFILNTEIRSNNVRMSENADQFVGGAGNCSIEQHH